MSELKPSASSPVLTGATSPRTPKKLGDSGGKSDKQKPPVSPRGLTGSGGVNINYSSPAGSQPGSPSSSLKRSASFRIPDENSQSWRTISMPGNKSERRKSIIKMNDTKKLTPEDFLKEDNLEIWRPNMYRSTSLTSLTKAWKDGEDKAQGMTVSALHAALKESIFDPKFYKRQRSDSLPMNFVFFSNDEEEALIDYQEKLNAAPSVARIRKARERGESISNSSASGDISLSVASGDLDDSDDEDDIMREASEVRLAAEGLQLPDDVFSITHEELGKRMTEEEKEDLSHIVVDDQGHIESGTIRALIRRLTSHLQEAEFLDSFMYTYDIFIDAYTLLKALILLYRCPITASTPLQNSTMISSSSAPSIGSNGPTSLPTVASDDTKAVRRSSVTNSSISIGTNRRPSMTDSAGGSDSTPQSPTLRGLSPKLPSKTQFASRSTGNLLELAKMKEEINQQRLSGDDMDGPLWARPAVNPLSPTSATPGIEDPQQRQKVVLQFRIIKAIGRWIELRYEKLRHNKRWKVLFKNFNEKLSQGTTKEKSWATNLIGTRKEVQDQRKQIRKTIKASIIPHPPMPSRPPEFLELPLEELVKQMTLIDQRYFFNIKLKEYANKGWTRDNSAALSPNLLKFIDHFNQNSYWVASTIILAPGCGEAGPKQRAAIITRYIQMMELFKEINNFNAIQQIFSALNMSCVERLKKAWGCVQPKYMKIFEEMGKFVSQSYSYKEYREYLEYRVQPPIIPLQEVILRDLFFIEENPNLDPERESWVNFDKMAMLGKVFEQIRRCQRTPYKFKEDAFIQYYLANRIILKETDLFIGSKTAEPKLDPQVEMKKREQEKKQRKIEKQHERAAEKAKKIEAREERKKKKEQELKKREKKAEAAVVKPSAQRTLDDVLLDRKTYLEFETFMKTKYAEENLEFYESVHNVFKKMNFDDKSPENLKRIKDQSTRIYDKFVKNDAEFQINIGEDTREVIVRVCQTSDQPTKDLFDVAALEVKFNVLGPNFNEFIKSSTK